MKNNKQNSAIIASVVVSIILLAMIWMSSGGDSKELSDYIPLAREDIEAFMSDNGLEDEDDLDIYSKDGIMITLSDRGNIDMIMLDAPGYTLYGVEVGDKFDALKDSKKFSEHGYSFLGESDLGEIAYGMPDGKEELGGDRLIGLRTDENQIVTEIVFTSTGARDWAAEVAAETNDAASEMASTNTGEKQTTSENFQIGEVVTTDNFEFTVTNAYVLDNLGAGKKVPEGAVYVVVEYEYKNISKQAISSWDLPKVKLADGNDAVYSQDMDADWYFDGYSDSKIMSDMNPGIKSKDAKIFEVAIEVLNAGGMKVYVQADQEFLVDLNLHYEYIPTNVYEEGYSGNVKADDYYEEFSNENENVGDAGYGYILEDSARRYLTEDELINMSKEELRLARNEIFARHGRKFDALDLQSYFNSMEWYYGTVPADEFDESVLNEYEKANLVLIKDVEMKK